MKTLKFLFVALVLVCFIHVPVSAQNNKIVKGTEIVPVMGLQFPCLEESISGTIVMEFSYKLFMDHKSRVGVILQHYKNTGTFIGVVTKADYTMKDQNTYFNRASATYDKGYVKVTANTWILKDGEKVARIKLRHHLTFVNGEAKAEFHVEDVKCF